MIEVESNMNTYKIETDDDKVLIKVDFNCGSVYDHLTREQALDLGLALTSVSRITD